MWRRIKRLWELSAYQPTQIIGELRAEIEKIPTVPNALFIPRIKEKPIDKITKIANEHAA